MNLIRTKCPECAKLLAFQERPGYQNFIIQCPQCGFKARANVFLSGRPGAYPPNPTPPPPMTPQPPGGGINDGSETEYIKSPGSASDIGQIRVRKTGEIQYLRLGDNVIGRRANSGNADIKISNDPYMSRRHINIRVIKTPTGYKHHLVELLSTNVPKINGREITKGDVIVLKMGTVITLGETDIILETDSMDETRVFI